MSVFVYKPKESEGDYWGWSHKCPEFRNPSLSLTQVTQRLFFPMFFIIAEPTLVGKVRGTWWLASLGATVTVICVLFYYCCISNSFIMGNLYKRYFGRLEQVRSWDVEENPGQRASRRSCRVVYANIRGLHKNVRFVLLPEGEM